MLSSYRISDVEFTLILGKSFPFYNGFVHDILLFRYYPITDIFACYGSIPGWCLTVIGEIIGVIQQDISEENKA